MSGKGSDTIGVRWPEAERRKLDALVADEQRRLTAAGVTSAKVETTALIRSIVLAEYDRRGLGALEAPAAATPAPAAVAPEGGALGALVALVAAARVLGWSNKKIATAAGVAGPRISEIERGMMQTPAIMDALLLTLQGIIKSGKGPEDSEPPMQAEGE